MGKKPVNRDDTRRLTRSIVCVLTPLSKVNPATRKQQTAINFAKDQAKQLLNSSIEKLSVLTDQILPAVSLEMPNFYRESPEVGDGVRNIRDRSKVARGCVLQVEIVDSEPPTTRRELGISHLVAIQIADKDSGWTSLNGISSVVVKTSVEKLAYLLHDIILDIAMFHAWPSLNDRHGSSIERRIDFSKRKAGFAVRKSLASYYGPIQDPSIEYFSFAANARKDSNFSYSDYQDLWNEFVQTELADADHEASIVGPPSVDPVEHILQFHHQGRHISRRKLANQIAKLTPGTYLLLMTRKRPSRILVRATLARTFGRQKYRQGLWRIVPFETYRPSLKLMPYISLFKFKV